MSKNMNNGRFISNLRLNLVIFHVLNQISTGKTYDFYSHKKSQAKAQDFFQIFISKIIYYPSGCIKRCFAKSSSSVSTTSSSGTQQSTGQTAAH